MHSSFRPAAAPPPRELSRDSWLHVPPIEQPDLSAPSDESSDIQQHLAKFFADYGIPVDQRRPPEIIATPHLLTFLYPIAAGANLSKIAKNTTELSVAMRRSSRIYPVVKHGKVAFEFAPRKCLRYTLSPQ